MQALPLNHVIITTYNRQLRGSGGRGVGVWSWGKGRGGCILTGLKGGRGGEGGGGSGSHVLGVVRMQVYGKAKAL